MPKKTLPFPQHEVALRRVLRQYRTIPSFGEYKAMSKKRNRDAWEGDDQAALKTIDGEYFWEQQKTRHTDSNPFEAASSTGSGEIDWSSSTFTAGTSGGGDELKSSASSISTFLGGLFGSSNSMPDKTSSNGSDTSSSSFASGSLTDASWPASSSELSSSLSTSTDFSSSAVSSSTSSDMMTE
eukprot:g38159.t1